MTAAPRTPTYLGAVPRAGPPAAVLVMASEAAWEGRVAALLRRDGLDAVVASARSLGAVPEALGGPPDVALLTHPSDHPDPLATIRRIRRRLPEAATVVVERALNASALRELVGAGADGIVLETDLDTKLPLVVRAVCAGQLCVPRKIRQVIEPRALSHREKQILGLVVAGLTNAQIAARLSLAESTVKTHLSSAYRRLGTRSRREAAALVLDQDDRFRRGVLIALGEYQIRMRALAPGSSARTTSN
jgi:two-component system, NarL family, response regulator DesR